MGTDDGDDEGVDRSGDVGVTDEEGEINGDGSCG